MSRNLTKFDPSNETIATNARNFKCPVWSNRDAKPNIKYETRLIKLTHGFWLNKIVLKGLIALFIHSFKLLQLSNDFFFQCKN